MSKPQPTYVKDAEGIAKAWGLRLYEQRKMMVKQLDAVRAAMLTPGFPATIKGKGYERAAVIQWGMANLEIKNGERSFEIHPVEDRRLKIEDGKAGKSATPPSSPDLPPQSAPPADVDLFAGMTATEMRRGRFDRLQDMYLRPEAYEQKIAKFEIEELKAERPHIFAKDAPKTDSGGADGENITGTLRGVAGWIRVNYPGCNPTHTDIKNWKAGAHLPHGCRENFPSWDDSGNRHKTTEVRAWVERYLVKRAVGQSLPMDMDYRQAQEKLDYERSVKENELWEQSISNKFMETSIVSGFIEGFGSWLAIQQDRLIEDKTGVRRLVADAVRALFNASPEQLSILDAQILPELVSENDAMKTASSHQGAELLRQLTGDRTESVQKAKSKNV